MCKNTDHKVIVQDENLLGVVFNAQPRSIQILATSTIRGCIYGPLDGVVPLHESRWRPATLADFYCFRVSPIGYNI